MDSDLNLKDTELRLGLPGSNQALPSTADSRGSKRTSSDATSDATDQISQSLVASSPPTKTQVVGWPPIRAYRRNSFHQQADQAKEDESQESGGGGGGGMMMMMMMYVKVSMDGAPYLRKIDIKGYKGYQDLLKALEGMFKFTLGEYSEREGYIGSEYVPTYKDKDGDWMLVGDVPWEMFMSSCKRLRIMKGSEAKGLACNM